MARLSDLVPADAFETVTVGAKKIDCRGIPLEGLSYLISKFNEVKNFVNKDVGSITAKELMSSAPAVIGLALAMGTTPRDAYASFENWLAACEIELPMVAKLPPGTQVKLFTPIFKLTFPDGARPFVESLTTLAGLMGMDATMGNPSKTSSVARSRGALVVDIPKQRRIRTRRAA